MRTRLRPCAVLALLASGAAPSAQLGHPWTSFSLDASQLDVARVSSADLETDLASGDLDRDGWIDLVVVRKEPFTTDGKRTNVLLMNESGVLRDRTDLYATLSDGGQQGFADLTNDRDVLVADLDDDGWLDLVTATTISPASPKSIGHPRVYRNRGEDSGGAWLGLIHQDARIPQLIQTATGVPTNPRFSEVAAGDVDASGSLDLYFVDHDSSVTGSVFEFPNEDLDDRLLVNDGTGFFTDESLVLMTTAQLLSGYGVAVVLLDVNGDGTVDVVKDTADDPERVRVVYNDPGPNGGFDSIGDLPLSLDPYHVDAADLNRDGRPDLVVSEDFVDRYFLNEGNDAQGEVDWSVPLQVRSFTDGDTTLSGNITIADLDRDGWNDVLIADMDVDLPYFFARAHVYHNRGGVSGGVVELWEEREQIGGGGWVGAAGLTPDDLTTTWDVAALDLDRDDDLDLVVSRRQGTSIWINDLVCQHDNGFGGPGSARLSMCGPALAPGASPELRLDGAAASAPALLVVGFLNSPTPVFGGTLVPIDLSYIEGFLTGPDGSIVRSVPGGHAFEIVIHAQFVIADPDVPGGLDFSNALALHFLP